MRYQTIFFDLDGTLSDPELGICSSIQYALEKGGYPVEEDRSRYDSWIGPPLLRSFELHLNAPPEECQRLLGFYRERFSTVGLFENEVYPGIPELLSELNHHGARLIVATGKPTVYSIQILDHFGLLPCFELISGISLDNEPLDKSGVIIEAMRRLNIRNRGDCVMIGDRDHDINGARMSGMDSIGVTYGYGTREELETAGADFIVDSVRELRELLLS